MKLTTLKAAIRNYTLSADCPENERDEAFKAYEECVQLEEHLDRDDSSDGIVHIVTNCTMMDLLNGATYDIYGKAARQLKGRVPFKRYASDVRNTMLEGGLTDKALLCGYDFLADLWGDNEATGDNNEDGTFKRYDSDATTSIDTTVLRRLLNTAKESFETMLLVNGEFYEQNDIDALNQGISDVDTLTQQLDNK